MFGAVADLIGKRCGVADCHDGTEANHTNFTKDAGLHMRLMGTPPMNSEAACNTQTLVVPNMPEKSLLVAVIGADNAPRNGCAERMPFQCMPGGTGSKACFTDAEIMLIRNWVSAGAPQ
jgi:hypothetical protein